MKLTNLIAAGAALVAGLTGGTATYLVAAQTETTSEAPPARTTEVSATSPGSTEDKTKPIVKLAPCEPPSVREGEACVTEVVETVVLPAPSGDSAGAASDADDEADDDLAGDPGDDDSSEGDDDGAEDDGAEDDGAEDDGAEDHDDDDGDEDHEDEDHDGDHEDEDDD